MSDMPRIEIDPDTQYMHTPHNEAPAHILAQRLKQAGKELMIDRKMWDDHPEILLAVIERLEGVAALEQKVAEQKEDAAITNRYIIEQVAPIAIEPTEDGYGRCRFCGNRGDGDGLSHAITCVLFTHMSEQPPTQEDE